MVPDSVRQGQLLVHYQHVVDAASIGADAASLMMVANNLEGTLVNLLNVSICFCQMSSFWCNCAQVMLNPPPPFSQGSLNERPSQRRLFHPSGCTTAATGCWP